MAETTVSPENKKVVNPRVEIDTSPPFESVKEAVDRFGGGGGPWIPLHLLRLAAAGQTLQQCDNGGLDMSNIEEQTAQLERDLLMKEQATLNILKELEATKKFIGCLKATLTPEASSLAASPDVKLPLPNENSLEGLSLCPGLMFVELNQAKLNLSRTSVDLAVIQASVESLNQKMRAEKLLLERGTKIQVPDPEVTLSVQHGHRTPMRKPVPHNRDVAVTLCKELNFEAEQFKKMTVASRYEVMKAMAEIERTKNSIKMAEMRINAAKKMEEAAKAVEAIACAEGNILENSLDGITLSFDEFHALTKKAQQAEDLCKTKFIDTNAVQIQKFDVPVLEKFEEFAKENTDKLNFRNSHPVQRTQHIMNENRSMKEQPLPCFTSTTSIGDILSRKLILQDGVMSQRHVENDAAGKPHVSLSEMLQEQSRVVVHAPKPAVGDRMKVEKQYFMQRKKFGFIQVPIPTKKKTRPLNVK